MTTISFGNQHDKSRAEFDIATATNSTTKITVGDQHDESTRDVSIHDTGNSLVQHKDQDIPVLKRNLISNHKAEIERTKHVTQRLNAILAFAFGLILIAAILTLAVVIKNPTHLQVQVFSVVLALAAGGFATVLSGMLNVRLNLGKKVAIGATGALAVFVIVYFFVPAMAR
jgi:hypothetical protein